MRVVKCTRRRHHHHFLAIILFIIIVILSFIVSFFYYIKLNAPVYDENLFYEKQASIIYDKNLDVIARLGDEDREIVQYEDLPQVLIDAIVATEDNRFFQHNGFDLMRFIKASIGQLKGDKNAGGASTITMQLSKNTFTSNEAEGITGIIRKFTDIYLAVFEIETHLSKEEILEIYVNAPYLGNNSYGVEMASQNYFGKSVRDITLSEAALLAGLFNAPGIDDPYYSIDNATTRRNEVLALMYKHGYITKEQYDDELKVDVASLLTNHVITNKYQGFIDTVVWEVVSDLGVSPYNVPMIIYTTLDPTIQDAVDEVMNNPNNFKDDIIQAGLAVTSSIDGSIVAIGSGRNRTGQLLYNYATMINRQPGSAIKPFMDYGPLFEYTDATPNDLILDAPYSYTDGSEIYNANRDYKGYITLKDALAESRNIPALKVFQQVDKNLIANYVHSFGIDYGKNLYESASIGAFEGVSPLTLSAAYGAYARGGIYIEPYSYTKIILRATSEEIVPEIKQHRVCSEKTAKYINDILLYAVDKKSILGTLDIGDTEAAGKTGTTTVANNVIEKLKLPESTIMDTWGCLYTREYSVSLWYGYDEVTKKTYTLPVDGTLGRRRILKKFARLVLNTGSSLVTSD